MLKNRTLVFCLRIVRDFWKKTVFCFLVKLLKNVHIVHITCKKYLQSEKNTASFLYTINIFIFVVRLCFLPVRWEEIVLTPSVSVHACVDLWPGSKISICQVLTPRKQNKTWLCQVHKTIHVMHDLNRIVKTNICKLLNSTEE